MATVTRTCTLSDLAQVLAMYAELYSAGDSHDPPERLRNRLSDFFLVADVDGQLAGFVIGERGPVDPIGAALAREAFPDSPAYLEIQDLFVKPEHRNQGIGSLLMTGVLKRGRDAGLAHSMVYSNSRDFGRIGRFYERFGFQIDHLFMKQ